jgi:hypothetical protein
METFHHCYQTKSRLTAKDIKNLFDLLKHNQVEVNHILEQKRKEKEKELSAQLSIQPPVVDPLALVSLYHQNQSSFNSNNETHYSLVDDAIDSNQDPENVDLTKIVQNLALLGKQIQRSFYKRPTNNNIRTTSAPTALNKRQDILPRGEVIRQGAQKDDKNDGGQDNQEPKCFGCDQLGHFAKNCPNGKVRNRAYYRQKMLLPDMEEKG